VLQLEQLEQLIPLVAAAAACLYELIFFPSWKTKAAGTGCPPVPECRQTSGEAETAITELILHTVAPCEQAEVTLVTLEAAVTVLLMPQWKKKQLILLLPPERKPH
jgi:hypothetical protein